MMEINKENLDEQLCDTNIKVKQIRPHLKASELYVVVDFTYEHETWSGWIPYVYRRSGLDIQTAEALSFYLKELYDKFNEENRKRWYQSEEKLWQEEHSSKVITKPYFDAMLRDDWACRKCTDKITNSSNNARRIQDIKEMGYTLATNTTHFCKKCQTNTTHDLLLPVDIAKSTGYETWSVSLRDKIMTTLNHYDVYEGRQMSKTSHLIPDHKFPEIRWDAQTREENLETMTEEEISSKFQLLSNQRNLQKREVCRNCFNTNSRGKLFGINYFYEGDETWDETLPKVGKEAERGCVGCGWYDILAWRESLNQKLT